MALYLLRAKHISRGTGALVTRAAAYRSGERIRDERTNKVFDFSSRNDVAYKEVVLPAQLAGRADMDWTQNRATLWNAVEHSGLRRNSRLAREWMVSLPAELNMAERNRLARTFASELANQYGSAVDLSVHEPRPGSDARNHHAHLLMTTREVSPEGIGARTTLELGGRERRLRGLGPQKVEYLAIRARWAQLTNDALRSQGLSVRVDHRSLQQQGIDREPVPTIPAHVFYAERRQGPTAAGNAIRARYQERVEARRKGPEELARVIAEQRQKLRENAAYDAKGQGLQPGQSRWSSLQPNDDNQRRTAEDAAQAWRAYRNNIQTVTQAEAAANWKAFRESQKLLEIADKPGSRGNDQRMAIIENDAKAEGRLQRERDHDFGL